MPALISGLAAGIFVALVGEAMHLQHDSSIPAATTAPVLSRAAAEDEPQAVVTPAADRKQTASAPESRDPREAVNQREPVKHQVRRGQSPGAGHARHAAAVHTQKPKRHRILGLPFFVSTDLAQHL
jgi:hypothetical protein